MEIKDLSWNETTSKRFNHLLLPKSIRGLIIGKSGCGKTTLLLNLLLRQGWLDYNNLAVFGKSLFQPEYMILKRAFESKLPKDKIIKLFELRDEMMRLKISPACVVEEIGRDMKENKSDIDCKFFDSASDVPDPSDLNATKKNLMVFDDLQLEKQNTCEKYYIRGRHSNVDCFYLAQNYFKLPRQTIRENSNFIICLFPQDQKNVNHIYSDHVSTDMPKDDFKQLCSTAWREPRGFVVIDLSSKPEQGKYRSGLDTFYIK